MIEYLHTESLPRVLIYRSDLLPVSETFILEQAEALRQFQPIYAGLRHAPSSLAPAHRSIILTSSSTPFSSGRALFYKFTGYGRTFESEIAKVQPVLCHAHFAIDGATVMPLIRHLNIPLIVSLHGYDVTSSDQSLRKNAAGALYLMRRRELWKRTHVFICVSEFIYKKAVEAGFPEKKLRMHYTGVNCNSFSRTNDPRSKNILFTGRLVEKKGCRYLLDAVAEVRRTIPEISLTVIGDGPLRGSLESQAKRLKLNIRFMGVLPASEVRRYMALASIFCVPSVQAENGDSEGFGMVFAEAQAMGTPVVSSIHGGIPEAVEDGVTGLLVPERDTRALASAINQLLGNAALWDQFSVRGSDRIGRQFCLERQTHALEAIYAAACQLPTSRIT